MNVKQGKQWRSIKKALGILHAEDPKIPHAESLAREIHVTLAEIERLFGVQRGASEAREGHTLVVARVRGELRDRYMYPVARRGPALMKWAPSAESALRLPHMSVGNARLIAAARAMVKVVALKPTLFSQQAGFEKDLLSKLRASVRELEGAIAGCAEATRLLTKATREFGRAVTRGRSQLRMLEGVLKAYMHNNPGFARLWREATRIPEKLGRPRKKKRRPPGLPPTDT